MRNFLNRIPLHLENGKLVIAKKWAVVAGSIVLVVGLILGAVAMYAYATPVIKNHQATISRAQDELSAITSQKHAAEETADKAQQDLSDYMSSYGDANDLAKQAEDSQKTLDETNKKIEEAEQKLKAVNGEIDKKKGDPIQLEAGEYYVGKHVPAGRYIISGSSNFKTYTSSGHIDINTILGDSAVGRGDYHGYLPDGYMIKNYAPATLTPVE